MHNCQKKSEHCFISPPQLLAGLFVIMAVVLLRLALLPNLPGTDEGFYGLHAMLANKSLTSGEGLPPVGVLQLYPIICSWVFSWDINHILALRLCDMFVTSLLAWQMFQLACRESKSVLAGCFVALVFAVAINQPLFIQNGFKNAGFIAWLCFLPALRIGLYANRQRLAAFFLCGVLTCIGVFMRESFGPLALISFFIVWPARGRACAFSYAAGGIMAAIVILGLIGYARGGFSNIIEAYSMFALMATELGANTSDTFLYIKLTAKELFFLVPTLAVLIIFLITGITSKVLNKLRILFWLIIAFAPLAEIFTKGAYAYHLSFCLYGLLGLTAYAFRVLAIQGVRWRIFCQTLCVAGAVWCGIILMPYATVVNKTIPAITRMLPEQKWPQELVPTSNYLLMAEAISSNSAPEDTMEVSGAYALLHVLTQRFPPPDKTNHLFDLGLYAMVKKMNSEQIQEHLIENGTQIIVHSERPMFNTEVIKEVLDAMPQYQPVSYVAWSTERHYGGFPGSVYVKKIFYENKLEGKP